MAGTIRKRPNQPGRPWQVTYYDTDGRRRTKSFSRKLDAERFLATTTVQVLAREWVDPDAGRVTLGRYAEHWLATHDIRPNTRTRYTGYLRHILDCEFDHAGDPTTLRGLPVGNLRAPILREWQSALAARLAASNARTIRGVFSSILAAAVIDRVIPVNPLREVPQLGRPDRQLIWPMPTSHVHALRDSITPRYAAAIVAGAGLGTRRGECFGLTVDRVDFLRRTVTVDRQLVDTHDGLPIFGPPKTPASVRTIPAPQTVLDALAAHLAQYPATPGAGWRQERNGTLRPITHAGLLFVAARGGPTRRGKVGESWRDAEVRIWARSTGRKLHADGWRIPADVADAWRAAHPNGAGTRFHDLRHFNASTLIAAGCSVKTVQARLGHANASETLDTYAHLWPDDDDKTRAAIDAALGGDTPEQDGRETRSS